MSKPRKSPRPSAARRKPAAASSFTPVRLRHRHDGWTPERQLAFLDSLAASACVAEACASVGMSPQSARRLYARPEAQCFRMAWEAALDVGIRRLSEACLSRAIHGVAVPHFYKGEQVGEHRRYDDRLAMFLLRYRDPLRYAAFLDKMMHVGHLESAASEFHRTRTRLVDEAAGRPSDPPPVEEDPLGLPWRREIYADNFARAKQEAKREAEAEARKRLEPMSDEEFELELDNALRAAGQDPATFKNPHYGYPRSDTFDTFRDPEPCETAPRHGAEGPPAPPAEGDG